MKKMKKKLMTLVALTVVMTMTVGMNVTVHAAGGQYADGLVPAGVTPGGVTVYGYYYDNGLDYTISCAEFPAEYLLAIDAAGITNDMTEYEKCVRINNYLCAVAEYDHEYADDGSIGLEMLNQCIGLDFAGLLLATRSMPFSGVGLIRNGKAVCQGYTDAFQTMATMLGMNCVIVGSGTMNHTWNVVTADGVIYYVDVTWNDSQNHPNRYLMATELWADHDFEDINFWIYLWDVNGIGVYYPLYVRDYVNQ